MYLRRKLAGRAKDDNVREGCYKPFALGNLRVDFI